MHSNLSSLSLRLTTQTNSSVSVPTMDGGNWTIAFVMPVSRETYVTVKFPWISL
ncbi:hypothetical protein HMI54_007039 [Coelomomyces lativittatus]|nr:hypothetical protein HMI54_007039 [Coelomomyces lativittatus]